MADYNINEINKNKSCFNNFRINDRESCKKAIRNGGAAALVSAGFTAIFGIAGFFTSSSDKEINYFLDPWILVDVAFVVVLAIFIFKNSRIASTLLLAYFIFSKIYIWIETGKPSGIPMAIVFIFFYFTAMRGTYLWHSKYKNQKIEANS